MGNHGKPASKTRHRSLPGAAKEPAANPATAAKPKMVVCRRAGDKPTEKEYAFANLRNEACREEGCRRCILK
jgi:hypothetical protein